MLPPHNLGRIGAGRGVVWPAINPTCYTDRDKDAVWAEKQQITYPLLGDHDGKVGMAYGAKTSRELFGYSMSVKPSHRCDFHAISPFGSRPLLIECRKWERYFCMSGGVKKGMTMYRTRTGLAIGVCAVFMLFNLACKSGDSDKTLSVRIANHSEASMQKVVVRFGSEGAQEENYGDIPPNGMTDYRQVKEAFGNARITALVDGKPAVLETQDFHGGGKHLESGRHTFVLTINAVVTSKLDRLHFRLDED